MKHGLRVMLAQGRGSIVNVSSTYRRTGAAGASVYVASKHAVGRVDQVGGARGGGPPSGSGNRTILGADRPDEQHQRTACHAFKTIHRGDDEGTWQGRRRSAGRERKSRAQQPRTIGGPQGTS